MRGPATVLAAIFTIAVVGFIFVVFCSWAVSENSTEYSGPVDGCVERHYVDHRVWPLFSTAHENRTTYCEGKR